MIDIVGFESRVSRPLNFYRALIWAGSISARRKIGSGMVHRLDSLLTPIRKNTSPGDIGQKRDGDKDQGKCGTGIVAEYLDPP